MYGLPGDAECRRGGIGTNGAYAVRPEQEKSLASISRAGSSMCYCGSMKRILVNFLNSPFGGAKGKGRGTKGAGA